MARKVLMRARAHMLHARLFSSRARKTRAIFLYKEAKSITRDRRNRFTSFTLTPKPTLALGFHSLPPLHSPTSGTRHGSCL
jgi:hypothetical protein